MCTQHYNADYHQRNKAKRNAQSRARIVSDPERARREKREEYFRNKLQHQKRMRKWRVENQDRNLEIMREWGRLNRDRKSLHNRMRAARRLAVGVFEVTTADLRKVDRRQDHRCAYCLRSFDQVGRQWDHVVPISRGGRHSVGNLVAACSDCNASKGASYVTEWRMRLARLERKAEPCR